MKPRIADTLKGMGCTASVETFRTVLTEVKAELFPNLSIDELTYTRDEAAEYVVAVKKRLGAPRLTRVFVLRSLVGIRKHRKSGAKPQPVAQSADGQAAP